MRIRRAFFWLFIGSLGFAVWFAYNHPDWIVAGPPKSIQLSSQASAQAPLVNSALPVTADTSTVQDTSNSAAVDKPTTEQGPAVPVTNPQPVDNPRSVLEGGFDNRCYYLGSGDYTTVIVKDYDKENHATFPYEGELDENNAPASAPGSVAWCKDNDPYKSER